ncbi:hypothetical protein C2G38_2048972 [Gigaspora rosea]|uniref:3CxxC-type domain-containing protein n=1 Tax=Gigaspora rosea TaxID=44941 RepID=A0A397U2C4_9GLOM|nr:hypothetical protein C2G38_2048972 [Gigaspora rosea]
MYSESQSINLDEIPINEVICHLQWNKYYRVFGRWKCSNCGKPWHSAYTWISLQKFIVLDQKLNFDEYCMQKCKKCEEKECDDKGIILFYKSLDKGDSSVHKRRLCAKCLSGEECIQSGDYLGKKK